MRLNIRSHFGMATAPTPASRLQPIRGAILAGKGDPVGALVNITQHPQDATVVANESVTFTVAAQTASPYTSSVAYQWYKNGRIIPGAAAPTCAIPTVPTAKPSVPRTNSSACDDGKAGTHLTARPRVISFCRQGIEDEPSPPLS